MKYSNEFDIEDLHKHQVCRTILQIIQFQAYDEVRKTEAIMYTRVSKRMSTCVVVILLLLLLLLLVLLFLYLSWCSTQC